MKLKAYIEKLQKLENANPGIDVKSISAYSWLRNPTEPVICNFEKGMNDQKMFIEGVHSKSLCGKKVVVI